MTLLLAIAIVTVLAIVLVAALPMRLKGNAMAFSVMAIAVLSGILSFSVFIDGAIGYTFGGNQISGPIRVEIDALSAWFLLIVGFVFTSGAFYGREYLKSYHPTSPILTLHLSSIILLHSAIVGLLVVRNGFAFLIFWEIMAVSAFFAIMFEHTKMATHKAGLNYLIMSHLALVFLMIGFMWVAVETGSFDFNAIAQFTKHQHPWLAAGLFFAFFTGFGIKAGFVPLHTWLPQAHPAAPSHVSGLMSGLVVKTGVYGLLRILPEIGGDLLFMGMTVMIISVFSGVFGILNASLHRDIKRMLAYCTIENIGVIGLGIGLGLVGLGIAQPTLFYLGFGGALLHTLNHALVKPLLFFGVGAVYRQTHSRDMDMLGGLSRLMPKTTVLFVFAALAICAIPPLNGFYSEFMVYNALVDGLGGLGIGLSIVMVLSLGGLALMGGLALFTFTKTIGTAFFGTARHQHHQKITEVPFSMLWPQYMLMGVVLVVAVIPSFFMAFSMMAFDKLGVAHGLGTSVQAVNLENIGAFSIGGFFVMAVVLVVWLVRRQVIAHQPQTNSATWGCGYVGESSKLQYTGKSFGKPLGKMFGFLVWENKRYKELASGDLFPSARSYVSHYIDFFDRRLITPVTDGVLRSINYLNFIQNGKVQSYVLYGVLFIVVVFVITYINSVWEAVSVLPPHGN
jgi:hydrogenase-4 component B